MTCTIRKATADDIHTALDLALQVFMQYEAPEYEPEGVEKFKSDIEWKTANQNLYLTDERRISPQGYSYCYDGADDLFVKTAWEQ